MFFQRISGVPVWLAEGDWQHHQNSLQCVALLLALLAFAIWESARPRHPLVASTGRRWAQHGLLYFLFNSPLSWIFPLSAFAVALAASHNPFGLLNVISLPIYLKWTVAVLLLDLIRYGQHRLYHSIPILWRIHQVHHADPDCDCSTSFLFHPGEVLLTQATYLAAVALLAPPPFALFVFELVSLIQTVFEHANVTIPHSIDSRMRRFLITPDLHRIHHSERLTEQSANFGTVFPWWDRCFGTYLPAAALAPGQMAFGLPELDKRGLNVLRLLALPFHRPANTDNAGAHSHSEINLEAIAKRPAK